MLDQPLPRARAAAVQPVARLAAVLECRLEARQPPSLLRGLGNCLRRLRVGFGGVGLRLLWVSLVGFVLGRAVLRLGLAAAAAAFHVASRVRRALRLTLAAAAVDMARRLGGSVALTTTSGANEIARRARS